MPENELALVNAKRIRALEAALLDAVHLLRMVANVFPPPLKPAGRMANLNMEAIDAFLTKHEWQGENSFNDEHNPTELSEPRLGMRLKPDGDDETRIVIRRGQTAPILITPEDVK